MSKVKKLTLKEQSQIIVDYTDTILKDYPKEVKAVLIGEAHAVMTCVAKNNRIRNMLN